jgi:hypothetical protein
MIEMGFVSDSVTKPISIMEGSPRLSYRVRMRAHRNSWQVV